MDIEYQRQFYQLKDSKSTPGKVFEFQPHQLFAEYYINPYTNNKRVHNLSGTGLGKTMSALLVAKRFIEAGRNVYIIGFQEERFIDELLHQPSLGFVSQAEVDKLQQLESSLLSNDQDIKNAYSSYRSSLKSRLKAIKFFGYKLLTLRVYNGNYKHGEENADIYINFDFIRSFHGSLIICDEIQNAYNSIEINNWGRTLQLIFNIMGPNIYVLTISSTPFLISSEARDFLNMLIETPGINIGALQYSTSRKDQLKIVNDIIDFNYDTIKHLRLPDEINEDDIHRILKGKILFMPDAGSEYIPRKIFHGVEISDIPYLKFYIIPMSDEQEIATLHNPKNHQLRYMGGMTNKLRNLTKDNIDMNNYNQIISNINADDDIENDNNENIIISQHIEKVQTELQILNTSTREIDTYKKENNILIIKTQEGAYYSGDFLKLGELEKYSTKYAEIFNIIQKAKRGKILIYHYDVHGVGVFTLEQICKYNGIIDIDTEPNEYTRCAICYEFKKDHDASINEEFNDELNDLPDYKNVPHKFIPMRFISIHSKTGTSAIRNIQARYNLASNKYGDDIRILIGSRKIREGMDFKCVRTQITLSLPVNISMFIQLLGRTARQMSHILLKPEEQFVDEYILVCGFKDNLEYDNKLAMWKYKENTIYTPEIMDYKNKMQDYLKVQEYMRIINRIAADVYIFKTDELIKKNIQIAHPEVKDLENYKELGTLPYVPDYKEFPKLENVNNTVYRALKYNREEILTMNTLIKNALELESIWLIEDLWNYIINSVGTPNPATFDKGNYIICLQYYPKISIIGNYIINDSDIDIDCFNRKDTSTSYIKMIKVNKIKYDDIVENILKVVKQWRTPDGKILLRNTYREYEKYDLNSHIYLLANAIFTKNKELLIFYSSIFELYKYSDLRVGNVNATPDRIIGFRLDWSIYYIFSNDVLKVKQLAAHSKYINNNIIIGMYNENMDFKLRENIEGNADIINKIKRTKVNKIDIRKLSKGIMCKSVKKNKLYALAAKLDIKDIKKKANLCEQIKHELILREEKKLNGMKWFYLQSVESIDNLSELKKILTI